MFHRTQRLLLRPVWPEDWEQIFAGIADERVVRNLARAPWPYRPEDAQEFARLPVDPMFPRFLITRSSDGALVGCVGIDQRGSQVELGYWIARQHWGQGFATEAGRAALEIAAMLGHRQVFACHFLDNPASGRVLRKLGFEPTGCVKERKSCGRAEIALTAEYALELDGEMAPWPQAA